jgi:hypothetical protein
MTSKTGHRIGGAFAIALVLAALLWSASRAKADEMPVDLELVLAVDTSFSMDQEEQRIPVTEARDAAVAQGITINGLPVLLRPGEAAGYFDLEELDVYYQDCVIGGPGSFTIPVYDRNNFAEAIRRKLILEMAGDMPKLVRTQFSLRPQPRIDCLIGEKLWEQWLNNNFE